MDDATAAEISAAVAGSSGSTATSSVQAAAITSTAPTSVSSVCAATVTVTVTVTANGGSSNPTTTTAIASATATTTSTTSTTSSSNVQTFTGTLGGLPPAVVESSGDRPFSVDNDTFVNAAAALQRSCSIQHNACADAANNGSLSGGVGQCDTQDTACNAAASG